MVSCRGHYLIFMLFIFCSNVGICKAAGTSNVLDSRGYFDWHGPRPGLCTTQATSETPSNVTIDQRLCPTPGSYIIGLQLYNGKYSGYQSFWQMSGTCSDGTTLPLAPTNINGRLVNASLTKLDYPQGLSSVNGASGGFTDQLLGSNGNATNWIDLCPDGKVMSGYEMWVTPTTGLPGKNCMAGGLRFQCNGSAPQVPQAAPNACVYEAAELRSTLSTAVAGAIVTICNDINVTTPIKVTQSVSFVGQCPYPGCRVFSSAQIGGAVQLFQVSGNLESVTFKNLWLDGGYAQPSSNSKAALCPGGSTSYDGGAISTGGGTTVLVDSVVFTSNSACNSGGAISSGGNASISNSLFLNNTAQFGGAISFLSGAGLTIRNSNFSYNIARDRGSSFYLYQVASARIQGNLFLYNQALGNGGGAIVAFAESTGRVYTSNIIIAGNTFANNTCRSVGGGAILNHYTGHMFIIGNSFLQNYAPSGGAIAIENGFVTFGDTFASLRANQADDGSANIFVTARTSDAEVWICTLDAYTSVLPYVKLGEGGGVQQNCRAVSSCAVRNPCDPQATCTASNVTSPACSCPAGVNGDGYTCQLDTKLLKVGKTSFDVPPAVNLAYGGKIDNILTVIGPSSNGTAVVLPPSQTPTPTPTPTLTPTPTPTPASLIKGGGSNTGAVAGIAAAIVVLALLVIATGIYCYCRKRKRHELPLVAGEPKKLLHEPLQNDTAPPKQSTIGAASGREAQVNKALGRSWRQFAHAELSEATGGFSRRTLLGEGAFGKVYLATLPDGTRLAVKQLKDGGKELSEREFLGEVDALGRVRHRNLISLRGYYVTDVECFLVLDYAENGNLGSALRSRSKPPLDWETRLNIAVGAARGLSYLHNDMDPPIIHRDIKSANILLDAKMQALVADFGLAKLIESDQHERSTMIRGTYGYLAPEMVYTGRVTPESDVYSFGVVLLEIATGFRAIELAPDGSKQNLAEAALRNQHQPLVMMDSRLKRQFSPEAATRFLTIALSCVARDDSARPNMIEVHRGLEGIFGGAAMPSDQDPQEYSGSWFVGAGGRDPELSSGVSNRSHSSWSQQSSTGNVGHSNNYQMTMIREGR